MYTKKTYAKPVLKKLERLADITAQGTPGVVSGVTPE
jgi:hypothetical protein